MNRGITCLFLLGVAFTSAFGQVHLDLSTQRMLKHVPPGKTTIDLFVRGDFSAVKDAVAQAKGNYKFGYDGLHSVTIPLVSLDAFLKSPAIYGVENGERKMVALTDTAIIVNDVLSVHNGTCLDTSYLGDGVIMGIIDYGIDFEHPDFKKSNGDSRIRYLWDQNDTTFNSPAPYGYGREWNEFEINNGDCTHLENIQLGFGHGTTVSGIAAGNGRGCNGRYVGMAPNADMIVVAFNFGSPFLSTFADAVDYIFKKADAMGKPCVINASLGTYDGSHDGKDDAAVLVNSLLEERTGRVLVCAAGNEGNFPFHIGYDVTADTSFTWFRYNSIHQDVFFDFWADTQDFNNVYFSLGTDNPATWKNITRSPFFNVQNDFTFGRDSFGDTVAIYNFSQRDSNNSFLGDVTMAITLKRGTYQIEVEVEGLQNAAYYWSFITTGSGRVDGWNTSDLNVEHSDMIFTLPDPVIRPDIIYYKLPDTTQNIVSSFTCSDRVIAVGNFTNRKSYPDCDSNFTLNPNTPGEIFGGSSRGPTRTGLTKPDVSATGDFTVSSGNSRMISVLLGGERFKVGYCPQGCNYQRNGGTSMASPIVAGIAALYLQKHPTADWREVRDAILLSAKTDSFTGTVPNNSYGYGKVSGCGAMMMDLRYGCTDTAAFNYDSTANRDNGTCVAKIYGCMDTAAFNFNPDANTADTSCIPKQFGCTDSLALNYDSTANTDNGSCYYVGIAGIDKEKIKLAFIPNFFRNETKIIYDFDEALPGKTFVMVTNIVGQKTDEIELPQGRGTMLYHPASQKPGVYFYHLVNEGKTLLSGKLVIY